MRAVVLIPWATGDSSRSREFVSLIHHVCAAFVGQADAGLSVIVRVNGKHSLDLARSFRARVPSTLPVTVSASSRADKIAAVLWGASVAMDEHADVLVVIDNDVRLRSDTIPALLGAYRGSGIHAASAVKAPHLSRNSTEFQKLYSYAVHESFARGLFPKRATGSLYAVHPALVGALFVEGHAEGDLLTAAGATPSRAVVHSAHANTFEREVARRARHWLHSERNGFERLHSAPEFVRDAVALKLPDAVDRSRFRSSLRVWGAVHTEAEIHARSQLDRQINRTAVRTE